MLGGPEVVAWEEFSVVTNDDVEITLPSHPSASGVYSIYHPNGVVETFQVINGSSRLIRIEGA